MKDSDTKQQKHQFGKEGNRYIDDTFVFDKNSGLYKPKSDSNKESTGKRNYRINWRAPFRVKLSTDYVALSISLLGLLISIATLIVVCLYTYFSENQWETAASQYFISRQNLQTAVNNFRVQERAWVGVFEREVDNSPPGGPRQQPTIIFVLQNTGHTPAIKMHANYFFTDTDFRDQNVPTYDGYIARRRKDIEEDRKRWLAGHGPSMTDQEVNKMFNGDIKDLNNFIAANTVLAPGAVFPVTIGKAIFNTPARNWYIVGKVTYQDVFHGKTHTTTFCFISSTGPYTSCPSGNFMD